MLDVVLVPDKWEFCETGGEVSGGEEYDGCVLVQTVSYKWELCEAEVLPCENSALLCIGPHGSA